jgi:hypothetical protein
MELDMSLAAHNFFNPGPALDLLRARGGDYPFDTLVDDLKGQGYSVSECRAIIWRLLSLGEIEFTEDRD